MMAERTHEVSPLANRERRYARELRETLRKLVDAAHRQGGNGSLQGLADEAETLLRKVEVGDAR